MRCKIVSSSKSRKKNEQNEEKKYEKELSELLKKMNVNQLGKFFTVLAARNIVYLSETFLRIADEKNIHYLNLLIGSIGTNCILFFNDIYHDRLTPVHVRANFALVRELDRELAHARTHVLGRAYDRIDLVRADLDRCTSSDIVIARIDLLLDRSRVSSLDFILNRDGDREFALTLDCGSELECTLALYRVFNLTRNCDLILLTIEDAKTIIDGNEQFSQTKSFEDAKNNFLNILNKMKGKYWAEFFERLFQNNFVVDERDFKAILSLERRQFECPIAETSAYLLSFINKSVDSNEIRLMILGRKGEGKTSFAKRFQDLSAEMPRPEGSTKGIDVQDFMSKKIFEDINISKIDKECKDNERDVKIKIWDFAGHEVTHAAHKFFLTDKCVYVIVCQARQGESMFQSRIEYWLEHIRDYAKGNKDSTHNKPKIFILINKFDEHKPNINEASIQNNYSEYKLVFKYFNIAKDNQKGGELDSFRHELVEYILSINTKIPASYRIMQERISLDFEKNNFIDTKAVYKIIEAVKSEDEILKDVSCETILKTLHALAFCFWFENIKKVNMVVLNPRWITGAVYKIINWVADPKNSDNASMTKDEFHKALRTNPEDELSFPVDKDEFIFEAMKRFELAYSEDNYTLVIPHCLKESYPDNEVGLTFEFENSVQIKITIDSDGDSLIPEFPQGVIPRFIVKNYELIHKRNGKAIIAHNKAIFKRANGNALAEIKRNNNYTIFITVQGRDKNIDIESNIYYLFELVKVFKQILSEHKRFQEQEPKISYRATDINGKPIPLSLDILQTKEIKDIEKFQERTLKKDEFERIQFILNILNLGGINMGDTITARGDNSPITVAKNRSTATTTITNGITQDALEKFTQEIGEAIKKINAITEFEEEQKECLIELLNEAETATKEDDAKGQESCKKGFIRFMKGLGKKSEIVVATLANLVTIAGFFGLDIDTGVPILKI